MNVIWAWVAVFALAGEAPTESKKVDRPAEQATEESAEFSLTEVEADVLKLANKERENRGLPPLEIDPELVEWAREHANWMASTRTLRHTSKPVGENIATGQADSESAVRTWMNSPPHRANILGRAWSKIGAAAYTSPEGRIYWCLQFLR